jgi:hypothetical protein
MRRNLTSDERGFAMLAALFMVLVLSVLASSLMFVSRTETLSSLNYKTMTQVRYGAEAGVHDAVNHLLWTYQAPGTGLDPLSGFDVSSSPVRVASNGRPVVLSSDPAFGSNYPVDSVRDAFIAASAGNLAVGVGSVNYTSRATLLSMQQFVDSVSGLPVVLQRWQVTGKGQVPGAGSAEVEVSAIVERPQVAVFRYAAFATADTCGALSFAGGATVNSYDSRVAFAGTPGVDAYGGNVGTNGNTSTNGAKTDIHGTLSSPRTGVGSCNSGAVTALTGSELSVDGGLVKLPQVLDYPTPPPIVPPPPTTSMGFGSGCPAGGALYCTAVAGGARYSPPSPFSVVQLGSVNVGNGQTLRLNAGIYEVNSIEVKGDLIVESGPVIIRVADTSSSPITLTAGSVSNTSYVAENLQFIYGGTGEVKLRGNAGFAAVVYAPNAETDFAGNGDFYGAVLTKTVKATGGATINYDRALDAGGFTVGNPILSSFTWKSF